MTAGNKRVGRRFVCALALGLALSAPATATAQYDDEEAEAPKDDAAKAGDAPKGDAPKGEAPKGDAPSTPEGPYGESEAVTPDEPAPAPAPKAAPAPAPKAAPAAKAPLGQMAPLAPPRTAPPSAQEKETARNLMDVGDEQFAAGNFAEAAKAYRSADDIMVVPSTRYAFGKSLERVGRLIEARDALLSVARMPKPVNEPAAFRHARAQAIVLAQQIRPRIPTVRVQPDGLPTGSDYRISVDGRELPASLRSLPIRLNPGQHGIKITAPGFASDVEKVDVKESERRVMKIPVHTVAGDQFDKDKDKDGPAKFPPEGPERPELTEDDGLSPLVWIGFGAGGAGLLVGVITGAMSSSKTSELDEACGGDKTCPPSAEDIHASAQTLSHVSTIGFVVGVAGAGVGIVGLLLSGGGDSGGDETEAAAFRPIVAPGYLGVGGTF
jgi:hypothetical protein